MRDVRHQDLVDEGLLVPEEPLLDVARRRPDVELPDGGLGGVGALLLVAVGSHQETGLCHSVATLVRPKRKG